MIIFSQVWISSSQCFSLQIPLLPEGKPYGLDDYWVQRWPPKFVPSSGYDQTDALTGASVLPQLPIDGLPLLL